MASSAPGSELIGVHLDALLAEYRNHKEVVIESDNKTIIENLKVGSSFSYRFLITLFEKVLNILNHFHTWDLSWFLIPLIDAPSLEDGPNLRRESKKHKGAQHVQRNDSSFDSHHQQRQYQRRP